MRNQQEIWRKEHTTTQKSLPTLASVESASGVVSFVQWLEVQQIKPPANVIDIGCGKGRNACYFASLGYSVYAIDYIQEAIDSAKIVAQQKNLLKNITFCVSNIDSFWPYQNNFFDIAIDSFSSIDIETTAGRQVYRDEMLRTLKPGGYALVTVVSADDEWEKKLIAQSPGKEPHSSIWPQNGKFQKNYRESELREFYKKFRIVELKTICKSAFKLDVAYTATNFWIVLQKPIE